jgi:hypothetical protein
MESKWCPIYFFSFNLFFTLLLLFLLLHFFQDHRLVLVTDAFHYLFDLIILLLCFSSSFYHLIALLGFAPPEDTKAWHYLFSFRNLFFLRCKALYSSLCSKISDIYI